VTKLAHGLRTSLLVALAAFLASRVSLAGEPDHWLGVRGDRISVVAGGGDIGDGRKASQAVLAGIGGIVVDRQGTLYFSEIGRNRVRRVDAKSGTITTLAGSGGVETKAEGGKAVSFDLFTPGALAFGDAEKTLYIAEVAGKRVLKMDLASGRIESLGGPPLGFGQPVGLLQTGSELLVVDTLEGQVWSWSKEGWKGLFEQSGDFPGGIRNVVRDKAGNLVLSEFFGHRILQRDQATGEVKVLAGRLGEPGRSAEKALASDSLLRTPDGLLLEADGSILFADMNNHRIAKIDGKTGELSTVYESRDGDGSSTWRPGPLFRDQRGDLWVGDVFGNRVLRFRAGGSKPEVVAGGGGIGDGELATRAVLSHPGCLALDSKGSLYIADAFAHRVRRVDAVTGRIETVAGTGSPGYNGDGIPAVKAQLNYPGGLLVDGSSLYIGDYYSNRVRRVDLQSGLIATVAGSGEAGSEGDGGPAVQASMLNPHALTMDAQGRLIVTSAVEQSVRRIDLKTGMIEGVSLESELVPPDRVLVFYATAFWKDGFYLADGMRDQILFVGKDGVSRVVGKPLLQYPMGIAVSPAGELYISDTRNNRVVRWTGTEIEVVAENLGRPRGIAFDSRGNLFVADTFHNRVLKIALGDAGGKPVAGHSGRGL
jgi:sugar lactone lactonase YvrE